MRKLRVIAVLTALVLFMLSFSAESLRSIYSRPPSMWPKPFVEEGLSWVELGALPASPVGAQPDSLNAMIELGKILFFDPRLSASGKISCGTCHQPELNWTDGKERSVGHDGAMTRRNSPTIQNSWFYKRLFWDGRARDLQDQAFAPIISESEMGSEMPEVMMKLRGIRGYRELFRKAYGDEGISPERMTGAIAQFEKTIVSRKSRFDEFLEGNKRALTREELRGLHLFRTKAKCMNCHNGPLFSDNRFQRSVFGGDDEGHYKVTHKEEDLGRFKTPSLRDVMQTAPWGHRGSVKYIMDLLPVYNKMSPIPGSSKVQMLYLSNRELTELAAFLKAISAPPLEFQKPVLPE